MRHGTAGLRGVRVLLSAGVLLRGACAAAGEEAGHRVRLVAERASVAPGVPFDLAVVLQPDAGWHTYWVNPGDSGMAPELRWRLPPGVRLLEVRYPLPERLEEEGLVALGYAREAALLARFAVDGALGAAARCEIGLTVVWMVCRELCMPVTGEAALTLPVAPAGAPVAGAADDAWSAAFVRWRARLPHAGGGWEVQAAGTPQGVTLRVRPPDGALPAGAWARAAFYPLRRGAVDLAVPQRWTPRGESWQTLLPQGAEAFRAGEVLEGVLVAPGVDAPADGAASKGWQLRATVQEVSQTAANGSVPHPSAAAATKTGRQAEEGRSP